MGGRHRARPRRLWLSVMVGLMVVLLTIVVAGYVSAPGMTGSGFGFAGSTVVTPPPFTAVPTTTTVPPHPATSTSRR